MGNGLPLSADDRSVMAAEGTRARRSDSSFSPELALVDPVLAAELRANLPNADDTLSRIELLVRSNRILISRTAVAAAPPAPARLSPPPRPTSRRPGRRGAAVVAGGAVAAALAAALLIGVRVDLHGNPAGADTSSIGVPPSVSTEATTATPAAPARKPHVPARKPHVSAPAQPRRRAASPAPRQQHPAAAGTARRFVWAPVAGASAYRVQFFRGSSLVFSAETGRPEITIPATWKLGNRRERLIPGEYRWYVWPLHAGLRATNAVVQARLSIPGG
jgi:hypothetical protein